MLAVSVFDSERDELDEFIPLTREQAAEVRKQIAPTAWAPVIGTQLVASLVFAALLFIFATHESWGYSALYGGLAVTGVYAFSILLWKRVTQQASPNTYLSRQMGIEFLKIALLVGALLLASRLLNTVSWPFLILGMLVSLKAYWLSLFVQWRRARRAPSMSSHSPL